MSQPSSTKPSIYIKTVVIPNLLTEWRYFKTPVIVGGIVAGAIFQFLHNAAHNYVYHLAGVYGVYGGPDNELVDLGFKLLVPSIADLSFLPSNGCLYALAVLAIVTAASPVFTNVVLRDPSVKTIQILWRALTVCSLTIVLRCVSFLVTILPAPAPQCTEAEFKPPQTASEIFFRFDTDNGCSDLIFSSHMMYGICAAAIVTQYVIAGLRRSASAGEKISKNEKIAKYTLVGLCFALVIAEAFCIVAQNRHYSIDVWTSLYAVPLTWIGFYHFFPADPAPAADADKRTDEDRATLDDARMGEEVAVV